MPSRKMTLPAAHARSIAPTIRLDFPVDEALMKVSRLALLLGEELLGLGGALDQIEEIAKSRFELRDQNVGEPLAGLFLPQARGPLGFDMRLRRRPRRRRETAPPSIEVMIKRLPGQSALLRDELHRGEPVTVLAEDFRRGIEDAFTGRHLTILTYTAEMSNRVASISPLDALATAGMTPIDEKRQRMRSSRNGR